jgi:hypothetical protein
MNILEPYKINDVKFDNIIFKKIKMISNKKIIFLKYKDDKLNNFVIQLSKIKNNNVNNQNEIEFIIENPNYISFFEKLDNFIVNQAHINHKWFDHLENKSSVNYERILRDNNSIKIRLCNNSELVTNLVINDDIVTNFDDVTTNESTTKIILEIYAIWIKTNSFGLLLRPINILMKLKEKQIYNYKFLEESDNDSIVSELSESHFYSEENNSENNSEENNSEENNSEENNSEENNSEENNSEENNSEENNSEENNNKDDNFEENTSEENNENDNMLFIKTHNIFPDDSIITSSCESENDLNKLILG